jgi:hypothetical protein
MTDWGVLGLRPTHMCEGDQVCILAGANTPVVLRRLDNGHYQFLGEAYVHGIMMEKPQILFRSRLISRLDKFCIILQQCTNVGECTNTFSPWLPDFYYFGNYGPP